MLTGQTITSSSGPRDVSPRNGSDRKVGSVGAVDVFTSSHGAREDLIKLRVGSHSVLLDKLDRATLIKFLKAAIV